MADPADQSNSDSLDERRFRRESEEKKRELDLREREVAAKEREAPSLWRNPLFVPLLVAAFGFSANVWVEKIRDDNTLQVERQRAQSTLILEAIRTGQNTDAACKNLVFFVHLKLIDDSSEAIADECKDAPKGAPSLPANPLGSGYGAQPFGQGPYGNGILDFRYPGFVVDADTSLPLEGARVKAEGFPPVETDARGYFPLPGSLANGTDWVVTVEKPGYETTRQTVKVGSLFSIGLHPVAVPTKK